MKSSDDSDEDIFNAAPRPALGSESIVSLFQSSDDETQCEMLHLTSPQNNKTCSVGSELQRVMPENHQLTDSECCYTYENTHDQNVTFPASLVHFEASDGVNSIAERDCVVTSVRSLTDVVAAEVIGNSQAVKSETSCDNNGFNEQSNELLAELENEFACTTSMQSKSVLTKCESTNGPASLQANKTSCSDVKSLLRHEEALECRLQNTLETKKELEMENARLECKLRTMADSLEAAKRDTKSAKLEVCYVVSLVPIQQHFLCVYVPYIVVSIYCYDLPLQNHTV